MKQLAIIIPAYKDSFLRQALDSIAAQSCKDFVLYIGDDCSPYHLNTIVEKYRNKIDIVYKRFENNLGGKDLVAQWERCIAMSQGEPYIWLFSDDDVMEPQCVKEFLDLDNTTKENFLIHFNLKIIDESGIEDKSILKPYPQILSSKEYLDRKLYLSKGDGLISFVVEFIFSRKVYEETRGFQNYDLAWGADFMTWLKFSSKLKGIYTIDKKDACVRWRKSGLNISPNLTRPILLRKIHSLIQNAADIQRYLKKNGYSRSFKHSKFVWGEIWRNKESIKLEELKIYKNEYIKTVGFSLLGRLIYMLYCPFFKK